MGGGGEGLGGHSLARLCTSDCVLVGVIECVDSGGSLAGLWWVSGGSLVGLWRVSGGSLAGPDTKSKASLILTLREDHEHAVISTFIIIW